MSHKYSNIFCRLRYSLHYSAYFDVLDSNLSFNLEVSPHIKDGTDVSAQEVSAKARRESTNKRKLLAMATEHLSKELLKECHENGVPGGQEVMKMCAIYRL